LLRSIQRGFWWEVFVFGVVAEQRVCHASPITRLPNRLAFRPPLAVPYAALRLAPEPSYPPAFRLGPDGTAPNLVSVGRDLFPVECLIDAHVVVQARRGRARTASGAWQGSSGNWIPDGASCTWWRSSPELVGRAVMWKHRA